MSEIKLTTAMTKMLQRSERTMLLTKAQIQYDLDQVILSVLSKVLIKNDKTKIEFISGNGTWIIKVDDKLIDHTSYLDLVVLDEFIKLYAGTFNVYAKDHILEGL